jgi:hypothetical protein
MPRRQAVSTLVKALAGYFGTAALNITSEAMLELLDAYPRLRVMFMTKNYQREIQRAREFFPESRMFKIAAPTIHKCIDPLCPVCVRRRVEVN